MMVYERSNSLYNEWEDVCFDALGKDATQDLSDSSIKFKVTRGNFWYNDVAVDNLSISKERCPRMYYYMNYTIINYIY